MDTAPIDRVEQKILAELAAGRGPLAIEELRRHLVRYALYWIVGEPTQFTNAVLVQSGGGCMICGGGPVRLFVVSPAHARTIEQDDRNSWYALRYHLGYEDEENPVRHPPLVSVYQALWRTRPEDYFPGAPSIPLLEMPVLLLCDACADVARKTHVEVELGPVRTEREGANRITAEAAGVRMTLERSRSMRHIRWRETEVAE